MAGLIDVFVRIAPETPVRSYLACAVVERWQMDEGVRVHKIFREGRENFHWLSRQIAEEQAEGEYYVLADDDCLILGENWAKRAAEAIRSAGWAMLSGRSVIAFERVHSELSERLVPCGCMGCPCVIRKGVFDFSDSALSGPPNRQDGIISEWLEMHHWQAGFLGGLDYIHAGCGLSQVEKACWLKY